jgi:hypothetical protein
MTRTGRTVKGWAAIGAVMSTALLGLGGGSALAAAPKPHHPDAVLVASRAGTRRAAVPYREAQLMVPGSWLVESSGQLSCGLPQAGGMIFAGTRPGFPKAYGCRLTGSLAWIVPAGHIPPGLRHRKPTAVFHGLPVYRVASNIGRAYLVPELKVIIGARGPLAQSILATVTRSPLSVALKRGAPGRVPSTYRRRGECSAKTSGPPAGPG